VPRGRYRLTDPAEGTVLGVEEFGCGPAPSGWSYTSRRLDPEGGGVGGVSVSCDERGRQLRVELRAGGWLLRGGLTGGGCVWVRRADPAAVGGGGPGGPGRPVEQAMPGTVGFRSESPAFLVAVARLVSVAGSPLRLPLAAVSLPALAVLRSEQAWRAAATSGYDTEAGRLEVVRFDVDDLDRGGRSEVYVAGDVVLAAAGVELVDLDGPPWVWPEVVGR
jgi:hypothetical protein